MLDILAQPDDSTCGPTCLHALYRAYGDPIELERVIAEVPPVEGGGTLEVLLACHALRRGYRAKLYTYNLQVFDPTWFLPDAGDIREKLRARAKVKRASKLRRAIDAYIEFLGLGGELEFRELSRDLIRNQLRRGRLLLVGLCATYLYGCARELSDGAGYDDIGGDPMGHFVVLYHYDHETREVWVADPYGENPAFQQHHYSVGLDRLIGAIMLGVLTYDGNLLLVEPSTRGAKGAE